LWQHQKVGVSQAGFGRASALVQTRIGPVLKERATEVLNNMGLTVSDALRILQTRSLCPFRQTPCRRPAQGPRQGLKVERSAFALEDRDRIFDCIESESPKAAVRMDCRIETGRSACALPISRRMPGIPARTFNTPARFCAAVPVRP